MRAALPLPVVLLALAILVVAQGTAADTEPEIGRETALKAVAGARVSAGPEGSTLTRSPWGPELYRATVDSVVLVFVKGRGIGSGVIVSPNCHVVTNWHVVEDLPLAAIVFRPRGSKTLDMLTRDDIWVARVLKTSQTQDLALLQLDQCPAGVRYLALEDPDRVEVGQDVFAIGHPEPRWTPQNRPYVDGPKPAIGRAPKPREL